MKKVFIAVFITNTTTHGLKQFILTDGDKWHFDKWEEAEKLLQKSKNNWIYNLDIKRVIFQIQESYIIE